MKILNVTEIEITPTKPKHGLVGFASCVVNDQFYIGNIAIHTSLNSNDYRLVFPTKTLRNGTSIACIHPINRETEQALRQSISNAYEELFEDTDV